MTKPVAKIKKENLIFLFYDHSRGFKVLDNVCDCVKINVRDGTWKFRNHIYKIGDFKRSLEGCRCGILGVYDRSNTAHLHFMVRHASMFIVGA